MSRYEVSTELAEVASRYFPPVELFKGPFPNPPTVGSYEFMVLAYLNWIQTPETRIERILFTFDHKAKPESVNVTKRMNAWNDYVKARDAYEAIAGSYLSAFP